MPQYVVQINDHEDELRLYKVTARNETEAYETALDNFNNTLFINVRPTTGDSHDDTFDAILP